MLKRRSLDDTASFLRQLFLFSSTNLCDFSGASEQGRPPKVSTGRRASVLKGHDGPALLSRPVDKLVVVARQMSIEPLENLSLATSRPVCKPTETATQSHKFKRRGTCSKYCWGDLATLGEARLFIVRTCC